MRIFSTKDAPAWMAGTFSGTWLDYETYASSVTGYPALVPLSSGTLVPVQHPAYVLLAGMFATANVGNTWTVRNAFLTTDQANDYLDMALPADTIYCDIVTTDALYPDMVDPRGEAWPATANGQPGQSAPNGTLLVQQIRDGTVITISVDGNFVAQVDTSQGLQSTRLQLDGLSPHTVRITNTGTTNVPGADVARCTIVGVVVTEGSSSVARVWTSPVIDSGDPQTLWTGADWEQTEPGTLTSFYLCIGQTPTPDGSWENYSLPIVETIPTAAGPIPFTQEGIPHGRVGFVPTLQNALLTHLGLGSPFLYPFYPVELFTLGMAGATGRKQAGVGGVRARYARVVLTLTPNLPTPLPNGSTTPWVRSLDIYASVPERETLTTLRLPPILRGGALQLALQSARGAALAKLHADALELVGSYSIGGARGRYLQLYGQDQDIPQAPGIGETAYAAELQAALAGRTLGPSATFVAEQLSAYIGGVATVTQYGAVATKWTYTLSVRRGWANPVTTAQISAFVARLNVAGNIPTIVYV